MMQAQSGQGPRALRAACRAVFHPSSIEALEARRLLSAAITEFMASNATTLVDEDGNFADWIELYNDAASPQDLAGWYLTDNPDRLDKWAFPAVSIPAGQRLVVFASGKDRAPLSGRLHTNFGLEGGGEYLALVNDGRIVSEFEFGRQQADVSFGLDGANPRFFATPSPGAPNARAEVVINEIHYDPDIKTELVEFIELHNPGSAAVNLSGASFTDGVDFVFPDGTSLAPGGYLLVAANPAQFQAKFGRTALGPWAGSLSNDGETITLRNRGGGILDEVDYNAGFPWPTVGESPGYSIELINPDFDNNLGGNWSSHAAATPGQNVSVLASSATWRIRKGTAAPPVNWRERSFNDGGWQSGGAPIGYGENFIKTRLSDMRNSYTTYYLRTTFTIADPSQITSLQLGAQYDDGFNLFINGAFVASANSPGKDAAHTATSSGTREDAGFQQFVLSNPSAYLVAGTNVIAVQVLNVYLNESSDAFFAATLSATVGGSTGLSPTPGMRNVTSADNVGPQIRQVAHSPQQPAANQPVLITAKITDPQGIGSAILQYQLVNAGYYVPINESGYSSGWGGMAMHDDGVNGDAVAGDGIYSVLMPAGMQTHRRLIRYRIMAYDRAGLLTKAPYADDPVPNFAYFCYNGVPSWTGAAQPGVTAPVTYSAELMNSLPVYHLLSRRTDVEASNWNEQYRGDLYKWAGTLVYNGVVYDGVFYRARGGTWRYAMGKNMWKFDFPRGHYFQGYDDEGRPFPTKWDKLNLGANIQQGDYLHRGEQGLFESVGFELFNLAGVPASQTAYVQLRVIDDTAEAGADQYSGDLWGLYLAVEQQDGDFLDANGLPDGNLYKMEYGTGGGDLNNQGPTQPTDHSDLVDFTSTYSNTTPTDDWWRQNLDLESYYSYRAIVEAIHHGDIGYGKNYFYYHNPDTGKWTVLPWDLDLTWADNMYGNGQEPFYSRVLTRDPFMLEYRNRLREIIDLLFNREQVDALIDRFAARVYTPGQPSFVDVDRAMWDYNPIMSSSYVNPSKSGAGRFYGAAVNPPGGFAGMVQLMKDYVDHRLNVGSSGWPSLVSRAADSYIPSKPVVTRIGSPAYPVNDLRFNASPFYDGSGTFAAIKWRIAEVADPGAPAYDPSGPLLAEINAAWESEGTAYSTSITIPPQAVQAGHAYRVRVKYKDSTGRWSNWSSPVQFIATAAATDPMQSLRMAEIHYNPAGGGDYDDPDEYEFVELKNIGTSAISLAGVRLAGGISYTFGDVSLPAGRSIAVARNPAAFASRYHTAGMLVAEGAYDKSLSNQGDALQLLDALGQPILDFAYDDAGAWPEDADGEGFSLVAVNPLAPRDAWSQPSQWRASRCIHGTPGVDESTLPEAAIVVSEVLAHTDIDPPGDWIELHNVSSQPIDISGWWLSDSIDSPASWRIPQLAPIAPGEYLLLNQFDHFGTSFGLSEEGDQVVLSSANPDGVLDGYQQVVTFDGSDNGVSYARVLDSQGDPHFVPVAIPTPGEPNAAPRFGAVVISELLAEPAAGGYEFIEVYNAGTQAVRLYDETDPTRTWRFTEGVSFSFPANVTLQPGERIVIAPVAEAAFRGAVSLPPDTRVFGPYSGQLNNAGETLTLSRPVPQTLLDPSGYAPVDSVPYDDQFAWPVVPAGTSIGRVSATVFGGEPLNFVPQAPPTPGAANSASPYPAATIEAPDPVSGGIDALRIAFTQPVMGVSIDDFVLTRNGGANLLATQAVASGDGGLTWTLSGLSGLTWIEGFYTLALRATGSGIVAGSLPLRENASQSFAVAQSVIVGTDAAETITLRIVGSSLEIASTSAATRTAPLSALSGLRVEGRGGDDAFIIASALPFLPQFAGGEGDDRLVFSGGEHAVDTQLALDSAILRVAGAVLHLSASQSLVGLAIAAGGLVELTANGGHVLGAGSLAIDGGTLDLYDNALLLGGGGDAAAMTQWLATGRIRSAMAASAKGLMDLVLLENDDGGGNAIAEEIHGQPVAVGDLLIRYTKAGDVDVNGRLDGDDYYLLDRSYLAAAPPNADLSRDGAIDGDDYLLLDWAYLTETTPIAPAPIAPAALFSPGPKVVFNVTSPLNELLEDAATVLS